MQVKSSSTREDPRTAQTLARLSDRRWMLGVLTIIPYASVIEWTGPAAGASSAAFGIVASLAAIRPDLKILKGTATQWLLVFAGNVVEAESQSAI